MENREIIFGVGRSKQTLTSLPSPSQELSVHQRLIFTSAEMRRGTKSFSQTNSGLGARVACPGPAMAVSEKAVLQLTVKHIRVSQ